MKLKYILFFICLTIISCKNTKKERFADGTIAKEYELKNGKLDGTYKEYFQNGKMKAVFLLKEGVLIDSSIFYNKEKSFIEKINYYLPNDSIRTKFLNENGKVESTGLFFKNQKYGKWKYFRNDGNLEKVFEYKNIEGEQYTNQSWYFNTIGDTIKNLGSYYKIKSLPKSIKLNERLIMDFEYQPLLSEYSDAAIYISSKINSDFSNLNSGSVSLFVNVFNSPINATNGLFSKSFSQALKYTV